MAPPGKYSLAAFDLDGTLLEHESSWAALHRHFGTTRSGEASLKLYSEGKIDYREFMRRDISSWPSGVKRDMIDAVLSSYVLRKEAGPTIKALASLGIKPAIVSSGIDILAEKVAEELGIRHWVANGLRFDGGGRVLPEGIGRVDPTRKDLAYKKLLKRLRIPIKDTIAIGDTMYDLAFLKSAGKGFMLAHTTRVQDPEIIHIAKLSDLLSHLQ